MTAFRDNVILFVDFRLHLVAYSNITNTGIRNKDVSVTETAIRQ